MLIERRWKYIKDQKCDNSYAAIPGVRFGLLACCPGWFGWYVCTWLNRFSYLFWGSSGQTPVMCWSVSCLVRYFLHESFITVESFVMGFRYLLVLITWFWIPSMNPLVSGKRSLAWLSCWALFFEAPLFYLSFMLLFPVIFVRHILYKRRKYFCTKLIDFCDCRNKSSFFFQVGHLSHEYLNILITFLSWQRKSDDNWVFMVCAKFRTFCSVNSLCSIEIGFGRGYDSKRIC